MSGDPKNPTPVPVESLPLAPSPTPTPTTSPTAPLARDSEGNEEALDPLGQAVPEASREERLEGALRALVQKVEVVVNGPKFKDIFKAARDCGVFMTKDDPNFGKELANAKKLLG